MTSSDYRLQGRNALRGNWVNAIVVGLLLSLLAGSGYSLDLTMDSEILYYVPDFVYDILMVWIAISASIGTLVGIAQLVFGGAVEMGASRYFLKLHDGEDGQIGDLFSQFRRFGDGLVMHLLRTLYVVLWSLLFVIPGIVASYSYAMAPYILMEDPDCSGSESLKRSKALMQGHRAELFFLDLSFIGWEILAILTLGVGFLWLNPYVYAARAAFYRNLSQPRGYTTVE